MTRSKFISRLSCVVLLLAGLCACEEQAPDLRKHEQDRRLIGSWTLFRHLGEEPETEQELEDGKLVFNLNGTLLGLQHPGGKRLFYTKGDDQLFVFVYGRGLKLSNWTYEYHYEIVEDRLFLWLIREEKEAKRYDLADEYIKVKPA